MCLRARDHQQLNPTSFQSSPGQSSVPQAEAVLKDIVYGEEGRKLMMMGEKDSQH